ncbi:fatty acyl-AMP ligase [Streptomyces physcomitrii]|uniref:fatty acyl-AMP ligase n=1 Tax=Streptomyces physcomitrii TaxID=2724184 RepID=UPI003407C8F0
MTGFTTFTEVLRERAAAHPGREALVFLPASGGAPERLDYGTLDAAARGLAHRLRALGAPGRPVLLAHPPGPNFLKALAGCFYAGAVAVPVPLPGPRGERLHRLTGVLRDSGARLVLTDEEHAPELSLRLAMAGLGDTVCLAVDRPEATAPGDGEPPARSGGDLALVQYTSTIRPRGVLLSHRNLLAQQSTLQNMLRSTPVDRLGGWLPHFHELGLIAHLLHALWLGTRCVQLPPESFRKSPVRWLEAIGEHGITIGGAPHFAYERCVEAVTEEQAAGLDLSGWRLALDGGEPVRPAGLAAFARRFAPAGFRAEALCPGYGLAAAAPAVSCGRPGLPHAVRDFDAARLTAGELRPAAPGAASRALVALGRPAGCELRIVDPADGSELAPGRVGEIWVRGEGVARGHWNRSPDTPNTSDTRDGADIFDATLDSGEGGYLRTGDLGALEAGQLYVTGRLKDLLFLEGRTIHPADLEAAPRELSPALGTGVGAAFTVEADRPRLVLVHEIRADRTDPGRLPALAARIRLLIAEEFEVPAENILLVAPGTLSRTAGDKVRRDRTRACFLTGETESLYETLTPDVRALVRPEHTALGHDLLQRPVLAEADLAW